jgi:hypothetical protein
VSFARWNQASPQLIIRVKIVGIPVPVPKKK